MLSSKLQANPVIASDMKIRMRSWRTALGIAIYLGLLLFVGFLNYLILVELSSSWDSSVNALQSSGMRIYSTLAWMQFIMILLITPIQTGGKISGEREKQTLDLLLSTKMSSSGIILGKLISSISYIILLIITSIPLFSLIFLFGGITPGDMARLFLFYIITAFAVGSIGIFYSTLFKRTVASVAATIVTIVLLGVVSVILSVYILAVQFNVPGQYPVTPHIPFILYINPAVGLIDILVNDPGGIGSLLGVTMTTAGGVRFWVVNSIVMLVIAALLLIISIRRIHPVRQIKRKKAKGME